MGWISNNARVFECYSGVPRSVGLSFRACADMTRSPRPGIVFSSCKRINRESPTPRELTCTDRGTNLLSVIRQRCPVYRACGGGFPEKR
ncbi:unnamed protein product [Soboliphyme baturini]|uniref:SUEL-type lectin domain-containing protein n=1 Tax=Soboliphyme baturini TaxID=241478 RepID=A0A183J4N0_9BILA|nr:unnamed protein product [Soboliphyme baturini]